MNSSPMPAARSSSAFWLVFILLIGFVYALPCASQPVAEVTSAQDAEEPEASDPASEEALLPGLEEFVDGYMASYLEQAHVAGATLSIVHGGDTVLAKGYGWADVENRLPVDPERTLFRIGSISKTYVWTSIMQLVEKGDLDLDQDINSYFPDFQVPEKFDAPITLRHLMSHTAGFDEYVLGLFAQDETRLRPLGEILADELPKRLVAPGEISSYSNHGSALAMYAGQSVSGLDWNEYIEERILEPLSLRRTTFRQPVPEVLESSVSKGYRRKGSEFEAQGFEFVPLAPIGGASASATDMARYMKLHLGLGSYDSVQLLGASTARTMRQELFRSAEGMPAMLHGFYEMDRNGEPIFGHGGDTLWFHSDMALFPERDIGIFLSYNTDTGRPAEFLDAFVDHYYPDQRPAPRALDIDLTRFEASYRPTRYSHSDATKIMSLMAMPIQQEDGALVSPALPGRFVPIGSLLFQEENGDRRIAFWEKDGRVRRMFVSQAPMMTFERAPELQTPMVQGSILLVVLGLFLLTIVSWPSGALLRMWYGTQLDPESRIGFVNRAALWLMSGAFIAGLIAFATILPNPNQIVFGDHTGPEWHRILTRVGVVLGIVALGLCVRMWRKGIGRVFSRLAYSLVVVGFLVYLWQNILFRLIW